MARVQWAFLEGAVQEVDTISSMWPSSESLLRFEGLSANESAIAESLPQVLFAHLATHGFFDQSGDVVSADLRTQPVFNSPVGLALRGDTVAARNPLLLTGIVLAGANDEPETNELGLPVADDGILTAEEIIGLDLRGLELVTLSACETGLGYVSGSEGVVGLQRALHQAGTKSVVASLWKVDDAATQALMSEFYHNLWDRKLGKLEALRQAQLSLLRSYDPQRGELRGIGGKSIRIESSGADEQQLSPLYWAAFQLSGDWR